MPTTTELQPCATARERYGPGKRYRLADFERHAKSCAECQRFDRAKRKAQRTRSTYSKVGEYPLTGDVHKYLLIVPLDLWRNVERRRGAQSARSVLNRLLDYYAAHGMPGAR